MNKGLLTLYKVRNGLRIRSKIEHFPEGNRSYRSAAFSSNRDWKTWLYSGTLLRTACRPNFRNPRIRAASQETISREVEYTCVYDLCALNNATGNTDGPHARRWTSRV